MLKLSSKFSEDYISDIDTVCLKYANNIIDRKLPLIKELLKKEGFFEVKETKNEQKIKEEIKAKIFFIENILEKNIDIKSLDAELEKFIGPINNTNINLSNVTVGSNQGIG